MYQSKSKFKYFKRISCVNKQKGLKVLQQFTESLKKDFKINISQTREDPYGAHIKDKLEF